ncbi:hypothetical protein AA310_05810 [Arthrobacter sp. YC-RL1]|nr:hypothetical protein ATC04_12075 [Arthrobacter sp. YC-RL1]KLI87522.1 hypothetical protein AA310_05810 [Arthrobacter sp. YC-RL1]
MGASNVAMVFAHWAHLDHREARALTYMANVSLDADFPPVYFGGWEALAAALGADIDSKRESSRRTAVRVLGALAKAGAIVSSGKARTGVRAEYALALDPKFSFVPSGTGRNIEWQQVPRTLEPETATGTQGETARGIHHETATGTQGETATGTQGETATVPNLRQLEVPLGTTPGTTEEYLEEKLEEYHQPASQLTTAHAHEIAAEPISLEEERKRQMRELEKLIPKDLRP